MAKKSAHGGTDSSESQSRSTVKIHVDGKDYDAGDTLTFDGETATVETSKLLTASSKSGVSGGTYPVVSVVMQPGSRKVFRAIVGDKLYPIREYGAAGETISKIRAPRSANKSKNGGLSASNDSNGAEGHVLSASAERYLSEYLEIETGKRGNDVLSELVATYIKPKVEKAKATAETVRRLPADILELLGGAGEDAYDKIRKALGHP